MYSKFQLAKKYFHFYFNASNGKGHGIHSPFVFDFVKNVLTDKKKYAEYLAIEKLRNELSSDETIVHVDDFGAGSAMHSSNQRAVSEIARNSASSVKQAQLLFRIVHYYLPERIVELGTSLGISAAYMASASPNAKLITMEGATAVAAIAEKNFQKLGLANIEMIRGSFDETLPGLISKLKCDSNEAGKIKHSRTMVYLDGNHREEPTLKYFNMFTEILSDSSFIILDDIHWSKEMEAAWNEIVSDERALLTIDLFFIGIVFFRKDFKVKQHFNIRM
ncbi:MAG: class I SAM-dependent methyltransferase [Bacteroidetes bacterium]|nr:class I SAM-dependent methyltransferase [Bacteroidota bacterium]